MLVTYGGEANDQVAACDGRGSREGWMALISLLTAAPFHAVATIAAGALLGMNWAWWVLCVIFCWGAILIAVTAWLVQTRAVVGLAIVHVSASAMLSARRHYVVHRLLQETGYLERHLNGPPYREQAEVGGDSPYHAGNQEATCNLPPGRLSADGFVLAARS